MTKLVCEIQTARPALNSCDSEEGIWHLSTHFLVLSSSRMEKGGIRQKSHGK